MASLEDLGFQRLTAPARDATGAVSVSSVQPWVILGGAAAAIALGAAFSGRAVPQFDHELEADLRSNDPQVALNAMKVGWEAIADEPFPFIEAPEGGYITRADLDKPVVDEAGFARAVGAIPVVGGRDLNILVNYAESRGHPLNARDLYSWMVNPPLGMDTIRRMGEKVLAEEKNPRKAARRFTLFVRLFGPRIDMHSISSVPPLRDLEWLASLDRDVVIAAITAAPFKDNRPVPMTALRNRVDECQKLPLHVLRSSGINPTVWSYWDELTDAKKKTIAGLAHFSEAFNSAPIRSLVAAIAEDAVMGAPVVVQPQDLLHYLTSLQASGRLQPIVSTLGLQFTAMRLAIQKMGQLGELAPKSWTSPGDLIEQIDKAMLKAQIEKPESSLGTRDGSERARDRLAERDWEWAVSEYPYEYKRGQKLAPMMNEIVDRLADKVKGGETVFIHGRDGEILYEMLKRRPDVDMKKVRYGITSRGLTSMAPQIGQSPDYDAHVKARRYEKYDRYLSNRMPKGAVHVDTGFAGSIPRYLDEEKGAEVKEIAMISANRSDEQIEVDPRKVPPYGLRETVLTDLEHSPQRLNQPDIRTWGSTGYHRDAPGFWARLAGMLGFKKKED